MVLMPVVRQFSRMLQRNLVYTAITRAADKLVLLGEAQAMALAVHSVGTNRQTTLLNRLREKWQLTKPEKSAAVVKDDSLAVADKEIVPDSAADSSSGSRILTAALIAEQAIDPLIGMAGIKPQDL